MAGYKHGPCHTTLHVTLHSDDERKPYGPHVVHVSNNLAYLTRYVRRWANEQPGPWTYATVSLPDGRELEVEL